MQHQAAAPAGARHPGEDDDNDDDHGDDVRGRLHFLYIDGVV